MGRHQNGLRVQLVLGRPPTRFLAKRGRLASRGRKRDASDASRFREASDKSNRQKIESLILPAECPLIQDCQIQRFSAVLAVVDLTSDSNAVMTIACGFLPTGINITSPVQ